MDLGKLDFYRSRKLGHYLGFYLKQGKLNYFFMVGFRFLCVKHLPIMEEAPEWTISRLNFKSEDSSEGSGITKSEDFESSSKKICEPV